MASRPNLLTTVLDLIRLSGASYQLISHGLASSTEEIARLRGADRSLGVKALLMKAGGSWTLVALRAHLSLDNQALRRGLGVSRLRFASQEELLALTGLAPGEVPPFGPPALPFPLVADHSVIKQPRMAFTAGTRTDSVLMDSGDWARITQPTLLQFSREAPE